jgi:Photosynthetic reaction centre cytochrome C subunit
MMRFRHVIVASGALAMVALSGSLAMAQAPAGGGQRGVAPPEPHNLKVLPASTTTATILPIMRNFAAALGTNCGYCHVWTGQGLPTNDYASDEKPAKEVARAMMRMAGTINETLAANIKKPADQLTRVQCMTCHRGAAIPTLPPPAPAGAAPTPAAPPAGR